MECISISDRLKTPLRDFIAAYNFAKRLKTPDGLIVYNSSVKAGAKNPTDLLSPTQFPGLYTLLRIASYQEFS